MEARQIRQRARERLSSCWGVSIGAAAVAALLGGLMVGGTFLPDLSVIWDFDSITMGRFTLTFRNGILGLAAFVLGGTINLGYARFLLKQHDGQTPEFNDLFSQFDRFGTGFAQTFLRGLYIFLWSLLLIIPGVVATYSYAMTPFILAEHPNMTASQAIARSKELMDGHKMDLFYLDLTFLGWGLLCLLTLNLGNLALNPYRNASYAAFYRSITAGASQATASSAYDPDWDV